MRENLLTDADYEYIHRGTREKRHRLSRESYRGRRTVVFTVCGTPHWCNLATAVLRGVTGDADLWAAISLFKQKAGFHGKRFPGFRLQKDFYDHIIRKDEDVSKHFYYVLSNPMRAGLVECWEDYPYRYISENLEDW